MKKNLKYLIIATLLIVAVIIIWLIFNKVDNGKKEFSINDVSMSLKDETLASYTGATFILKNDNDIDMIYGDSYTIEVEKEGKWEKIDVKVDFNSIAYILKAKSSKEITINWENIYGKLEPGKYRLIKNISYEKEKDNYVDFSVNAEFILYDDQIINKI